MNARNVVKPIESINQLKRLASHPDGVECRVMTPSGILWSKTIKYFDPPLTATNETVGVDAREVDVFDDLEYLPMGAGRVGLKIHWSIYHETCDSETEHTSDKSVDGRTYVFKALKCDGLFLDGETE